MSSQDAELGVPEGWRTPSREVVAHAREAALVALALDSERPAHMRLLNYYDRRKDFAGASFATMEPRVPNDVTVADLHATTLLSVSIGPAATRQLLEENPLRAAVLEALERTPELELGEAGAADLAAMEQTYAAVKASLHRSWVKDPNPWVTASKICARKRPTLFPVRDEIVCTFLGLLKLNSAAIDWQVYRALVNDQRIQRAIVDVLEKVEECAGEREIAMDSARLRILDAALWTWASGKG